MTKCLFVSQRIGNLPSGATACSERNLHHCREIFGADNCEVYRILKGRVPGIVRKGLQVLGFVDGLLPRDIRAIVGRVTEGGFDLVFVDSSYFGLVAEAVARKCPKATVAVFYHDILVQWFQSTGTGSTLRKWILSRTYRRIEGKSSRAARIRICLTERDRSTLKKKYGESDVALVPVSSPDRFRNSRSVQFHHERTGLRTLLFVGVDYRPNVEGVEWFIDKVVPRIRSKLRVVGRGMENYRVRWQSERVEVAGSVDDLDAEYQRADAVVIPLFSGSGMKIKTVEALMHGKRIFGTPEAFAGFSLDYGAVGALCSSKEDFCRAINSWESGTLDPGGVNPASRAIFLARYSYEATLAAMRQALAPG